MPPGAYAARLHAVGDFNQWGNEEMEAVRDETRRRIEELAPGGGFVFAPIHVIQAGVPPENIMAWWETLSEYGEY